MSQQPLMRKVIGIPHIPSIAEINARPDAGTNQDVVFKVAVGTTDLMVIEVKEDVEKKDTEGKVHQWFKVQFPQGVAWVRDDLVEIWGDGSTVGYGVINTPTHAITLTRQATTSVPQGAETQTPPSTASEVSAPSTASEVSTPSAESEVSAPSTASEVAQAPATAPTSPGMVLSMMPTAKLRSGPGTNNGEVGGIPKGQSATFLEAKMGEDGKALYWVKCDFGGTQGWTREDLVRLSGNFTPFGLSMSDKYPNPTPTDTVFARGWDPDGSLWNTGDHHGWDHSGAVGLPIHAGPQGGVVFDKVVCAKCGSQGLSNTSPGVFTDPGWNYGYGHYIIVGYENSKLPASTRAYLESEGRAGEHIFVMYAHCQQLLVEKGTTLEPNHKIATLGNSGNSYGAHLHLEVRISKTMNPSRWAAIKDGLRSPGILFLR